MHKYEKPYSRIIFTTCDRITYHDHNLSFVCLAAEGHFGSAVPAFHPEFYLTMTKPMADERRQSQLEQYLQNVTLDSNITNSDAFIIFKLRQDMFKIQTQRAFLDVYLADGSNIRLYIQTDTAEIILPVTLCEVGLLRDFIKYFSLFLFQDCDDEALSVVEKVAELELPYVRLQSMKELHCKLGIRKCCMDPSLNTRLMDCRISLNLLHTQAVQEVKRNWVKPTDEEIQELQFLQKILMFDHFICDYPEESCSADIHVANDEVSYCMTLPANQIEVSFKINRLRIWQVTFLIRYTKDAKEDTLELQSEYNDSGTNWIILYTKQFCSQSFQGRIRTFVFSSCVKKMVSEQMMEEAKGQEMYLEEYFSLFSIYVRQSVLEIKMPEQMKNSKKYSIQQKRVHLGCISRKTFLVRPNEDDCVFEKIREEDLNNLFEILGSTHSSVKIAESVRLEKTSEIESNLCRNTTPSTTPWSTARGPAPHRGPAPRPVPGPGRREGAPGGLRPAGGARARPAARSARRRAPPESPAQVRRERDGSAGPGRQREAGEGTAGSRGRCHRDRPVPGLGREPGTGPGHRPAREPERWSAVMPFGGRRAGAVPAFRGGEGTEPPC
ncbi:LOW QUALITY PROTEIN: sorting nexin-31 [Passerculus sandwichensis]